MAYALGSIILAKQIAAKETQIYSVLSFLRRREPSQIKALDPRLRGDDELNADFSLEGNAVGAQFIARQAKIAQ